MTRVVSVYLFYGVLVIMVSTVALQASGTVSITVGSTSGCGGIIDTAANATGFSIEIIQQMSYANGRPLP